MPSKSKKVLVTGVAGFLGSHLSEKLSDMGHEVIGIDNMIGGYDDNVPKNIKFYRGKPTASNHNTGYKGRTAIHEVLEVNSEMRQMIFDNESQIDMKKLAMKNGMTPLRDAGIGKIKDGVTTIEEVLRATVEDN